MARFGCDARTAVGRSIAGSLPPTSPHPPSLPTPTASSLSALTVVVITIPRAPGRHSPPPFAALARRSDSRHGGVATIVAASVPLVLIVTTGDGGRLGKRGRVLSTSNSSAQAMFVVLAMITTIALMWTAMVGLRTLGHDTALRGPAVGLHLGVSVERPIVVHGARRHVKAERGDTKTGAVRTHRRLAVRAGACATLQRNVRVSTGTGSNGSGNCRKEVETASAEDPAATWPPRTDARVRAGRGPPKARTHARCRASARTVHAASDPPTLPRTPPTTTTANDLVGVLKLRIADDHHRHGDEARENRELRHSANMVGVAPTVSDPYSTVASTGRGARGRQHRPQPESKCTTAPREGRIEHEVHLQLRAVSVTANSRRRARDAHPRSTRESPTMPLTPPTTVTTSDIEGVPQLHIAENPQPYETETIRNSAIAHHSNSISSALVMNKPDRDIASTGRGVEDRHRHTQPDSR